MRILHQGPTLQLQTILAFIPWTKTSPAHPQYAHSRYTEVFSYKGPSPHQQGQLAPERQVKVHTLKQFTSCDHTCVENLFTVIFSLFY